MILLSLMTALAMPPQGTREERTFVGVVQGDAFACGRRADGTAACWGTDATAIAPGTNTGPFPRPVPVPGLTDARTLAAGGHHTCALRADASVVCWGDNQAGQLGAGDTELHDTVVEVLGLGPTRALALGDSHTCALAMDGSVSCWGNNLYGQLGTTDVRQSPFPLPIPGVTDATTLAAGYGHSCASTGAGEIWCWGDGSQGQLGRPVLEQQPLSAPAPTEHEPLAVRALVARDQRTCALHPDGVTCWGDGRPAELVLPRKGLVALSVGWGHGCALTGGGLPVCFGAHDQGQLGGLKGRHPVVGSFGVTGATSVSAGRGSSCAARRDATTLCWGSYTADEISDAVAHEPEALTAGKARVQRRLPPGTDLTVAAEEMLGGDGLRIRFVVHTTAPQACANTRLQTELEVKRKVVRLTLGDPILPDGACIASPAPAVATYDLHPDVRGRRDLVLRWKKREDFYQVYVGTGKVEIIPLQTSFSTWTGVKAFERIPEGTLAVSCRDHLEQPVCMRRMREGMPMCADLLGEDLFRDAPQLDRGDWSNAWFTSDPAATYLSPDFEHARYRQLVEQTYLDGSSCLDVTVRTWAGETWTNRTH